MALISFLGNSTPNTVRRTTESPGAVYLDIVSAATKVTVVSTNIANHAQRQLPRTLLSTEMAQSSKSESQ